MYNNRDLSMCHCRLHLQDSVRTVLFLTDDCQPLLRLREFVSIFLELLFQRRIDLSLISQANNFHPREIKRAIQRHLSIKARSHNFETRPAPVATAIMPYG